MSKKNRFFVFSTAWLSFQESASSYGGAVWDLKASPVDSNKIVVACEDGNLRFFNMSGGRVILESSIPCEGACHELKGPCEFEIISSK